MAIAKEGTAAATAATHTGRKEQKLDIEWL
jgi:hypothetical protein